MPEAFNFTCHKIASAAVKIFDIAFEDLLGKRVIDRYLSDSGSSEDIG